MTNTEHVHKVISEFPSKPVDGSEIHYRNQVFMYSTELDEWLLKYELEPDEYLKFMALLNEEHRHE